MSGSRRNGHAWPIRATDHRHGAGGATAEGVLATGLLNPTAAVVGTPAAARAQRSWKQTGWMERQAGWSASFRSAAGDLVEPTHFSV
jgi:hypothetical protein